ncbi:MAG: Glycerophosphoryl diester phosphodiesterase [Verrucomicrobiota bacterium]|jgi:glycerophosphoryl diester phosphodiesterase
MSRGPAIIAHRGASHDAPENTLASVRLGWAQGADAVEVDIQQTGDGHLVVIHDDTTRRTTGRKGKVSDLTLAELRTLEAGAWKHARWAGEPIPTLAEVLDMVPSGRRLFVEIKCGMESVPEFVSTVRRSGRKAGEVVPIGFDLETMRRVKEALPRHEVCWVQGFRRTWRGGWSPTAERLIERARGAGLDGLDLGVRGPVNAEFVGKVHAAGLRLYLWTVDAPGRARALAAAGVDGLTTNRPGWLRERLGVARQQPA